MLLNYRSDLAKLFFHETQLSQREISKEDLIELVVISARDDENLALIESFARKEFSLSEEEYENTIEEIVYFANLKGNDEVLKTVFKSDLNNFNLIKDYSINYNHSKDIYLEVLGAENSEDLSAD